MKKRIVALLLATSVFMTMAGCGKTTEPSTIEQSEDKKAEEASSIAEENTESSEEITEETKKEDEKDSKKEKGSLPEGWTWGGDIYADTEKKIVYQSLSDDWEVSGSYSSMLKNEYGDSFEYHVTEFQYHVDNSGHWSIEEVISSKKPILEEEAEKRSYNSDYEKVPEYVYETSYETSYGPVYVILGYNEVGETVHVEGVAPIVSADGTQVDGFMQFTILEEALGDSDEEREKWAGFIPGLTDESLQTYLSTYINALK